MSDTKRIKVLFTAWSDLEDEKKERTGEQKELVAEAGGILEAKPGQVGKLFKLRKKLADQGFDELAILNMLDEKMKD